MAIKVYGNVFSPAAARVIVALYEKELEFEFVPIDMKSGEHKKEPYLSIHPFGQVPAFEDGDLKLIESRAITQYIAHEYADKGTNLLCPGKDMAVMGMWMEVEAHQHDPIALKLGWELAVKPIFGMTTDNAVVEENEAKLGKVLDVYETRLGQSKYLAGDHFSLADLHHLPIISSLMNTPAKKLFLSRPHVSAWATDISSRPAWSKFVEMRMKNLN